MTATGTKLLRLTLSILMALVVIRYWKNLFFISSPHAADWLALVSILTLLFFVLNIAAAIGLFFIKRWGYIVSYTAILFSTFFFSTPYIPVITHFVPHRYRYVALIAINMATLFSIAYLQIRSKGKKR